MLAIIEVYFKQFIGAFQALAIFLFNWDKVTKGDKR
jgi:hypothetical protein